MRRFFLLFLLISSLFLTSGIAKDSQAESQNQDQYALQLQGFAWHLTSLNALVVTPSNASWWNPVYLDSTLRAIGQWNDAVASFASNYSDYAYISSLMIEPTVSNVTQPDFDIYINWTDSSLSNLSDDIGLSRIFPYVDNVIINCTTILAVQTNHGQMLDEIDMQNVALHELGHDFGLGHCNYTGDLMYPSYTVQSPPREVSSLDVYGVASVFAWELNASYFFPMSEWLPENSVILPSNIPYEILPVSAQNAPPQTLADNPVVQELVLMAEILVHPPILAVVVVFLVFCIAVGFVVKTKRAGPKAGS